MSKLLHAWTMQLPQHMGSALLDNWKLLLHIFAMQHMSLDDHVSNSCWLLKAVTAA